LTGSFESNDVWSALMLAAIDDECQCNAYAGRCRRCAARAVVAVDARADTDANCASHRVLQHVDNSLAVDNAMRVAQASVLLAQFGVSFDPFGGAKSRVTVSAYSAPRLAEARQRPARAALGACCHRCVDGLHARRQSGVRDG
jgi:hypothetical protein